MIKNISKLIEYGLYLLVFLLPLQTRWIIRAGEINGGYFEYGTISLYGMDILLLMLILLFIIFKFQIQNSKSQINPKLQIINYKFLILWLMVAGLALSIFVSIFFASDKIIAAYKFGVFLLGIGLFWLITGAVYDRMKLFGWFLAGVFLQAVLAIWQFLTQSGFADKWLGIALHDATIPGASVIEVANGGRWIRAYGGLDHPNMLGGALAIGILLMMNLMIKNRKKNILYSKFLIFHRFGGIPPAINIIKWRDNFQFSNNFQFSIFKQYLFFIFYFLFFIFLAALFFTFSRAAWVGLAVGILVLAAGLLFVKNYQSLKKLFLIILAGGVLFAVLTGIFPDLVFTRVVANARLETKSTNERIESIESATGLIKNNWLFGIGMGNYVKGIRNWESGNGNNMPSWRYQPVHNVFLLVWSEIGIFGLLFFILIPLFIIHYLLFKNNLRSKNLILSMSLLAVAAAMFMFDHWWWSLHFGVLLFWLILGIIYSLK